MYDVPVGDDKDIDLFEHPSEFLYPNKKMSASEASESESDTEYVVERIIGKRGPPEDLEYKVKWKGFNNPKDNTWEPLYHLDNCITLIAEFESRNQKATPGKKKSVSKAKKQIIFTHNHLP